ncbi:MULTISPECIES: hypothetical protein [Streptomyces]|uniref:hypothetical protein n=1 Tax=Streptomyces TaxID=1883 RepID=UPI0003A8AFD1|nr:MULTISPECIES: hypothetical protein [Streptomyces]MBZ6112741.1 hypothetical protein [Streptomyces olivaceus]MBZ6126514.1 hypothetical protein [Streptomyces olivaceus]MBZ6147423.1 hypothetical protein [Streptomyces olivaceus]MBZ6161173.1 hypothetical protein [Streptomyces olivaceus]MBZ6188792.1 hypothetical protein [Streptomyces olivaceus]
MTITRPGDADPVRDAILAAMDRLLAGTPLRSTGRLSVSQLAIEAGVKRWHLTHQHLDLKERFQARVKAQDSTPEAFSRKLSEYEALKKKYDELRQHSADLEERLRVYAAAVNLLALENAALTGREPDAHVIPLPRAQGTLGPQERHNR